MEKVQEIKNTTRLPRPETKAELDGGAASPVGDGTADGPNCVDGVLSKTAQCLGHKGDEVCPC